MDRAIVLYIVLAAIAIILLSSVVALLRRRRAEPRSPKREPVRTTAIDKGALRSLMVSSLSIEELEALCWDTQGLMEEDGLHLPVNLELVGGGSRTEIVMGLIEYFDRRGYLDYLVRAVRSARPGKI